MTRTHGYEFKHQESVPDHFAAGWIMAVVLLALSAVVVMVVNFFAK